VGNDLCLILDWTEEEKDAKHNTWIKIVGGHPVLARSRLGRGRQPSIKEHSPEAPPRQEQEYLEVAGVQGAFMIRPGRRHWQRGGEKHLEKFVLHAFTHQYHQDAI